MCCFLVFGMAWGWLSLQRMSIGHVKILSVHHLLDNLLTNPMLISSESTGVFVANFMLSTHWLLPYLSVLYSTSS